jgi:hypothetical protein
MGVIRGHMHEENDTVTRISKQRARKIYGIKKGGDKVR